VSENRKRNSSGNVGDALALFIHVGFVERMAATVNQNRAKVEAACVAEWCLYDPGDVPVPQLS